MDELSQRPPVQSSHNPARRPRHVPQHPGRPLVSLPRGVLCRWQRDRREGDPFGAEAESGDCSGPPHVIAARDEEDVLVAPPLEEREHCRKVGDGVGRRRVHHQPLMRHPRPQHHLLHVSVPRRHVHGQARHPLLWHVECKRRRRGRESSCGQLGRNCLPLTVSSKYKHRLWPNCSAPPSDLPEGPDSIPRGAGPEHRHRRRGPAA
mmetsp:Transcript_8730/g.28812  ORF Transcript_8730/g.28812 Transcript_8730/m.28812 type:complete len:206 (-) Transcript_8730:27-644(-)